MVIVRLAKDKQEGRLNTALELLRHVSGVQKTPMFLRKRISNILQVKNNSEGDE